MEAAISYEVGGAFQLNGIKSPSECFEFSNDAFSKSIGLLL